MDLFRSYIDGHWVDAGEEAVDENPSDLDSPAGRYMRAGREAVAEAAFAARRAYKGWSATNIQERADILQRAGQAIMERRDAFGRMIALEEGKVLAEGVAEAVRAARLFTWFAGEAMRNTGDHLDSIKPGAEVEIVRQPVGVVGAITPWNFPLAIPAWKVAPALAFGNTLVMKPAEATPGIACMLVEVLESAGLPAGVFNLVLGRGSEIGDAIVNHPDIDAITFTGSTETGRAVAIAAASRLTKVQLELGGKNPLVVLDDADLDVTMNAVMAGLYFGTGQKCTSSSRFIVQDGIHDAFVARVKNALETTRVGHALDPDSRIGPVANADQLAKDLDYVDIGRREGAHLVSGGDPVERKTRGHFLSPALFTETSPDMRINREEIFGPIGTVLRVRNYDEALAAANDTEYGLSAGICTTSLKHASHFKRHIEAGVATVNLPTSGGDYHVAFGGWKQSGYGGKEQGAYAREFFTRMKSAYTLS